MTSPLEGGALSSVFSELNDLRQKIAEMSELAIGTVEGSAAGGLVRVRVSGAYHFERVHIDERVLQDHDAARLEDLLLSALSDASSKLALAQDQARTRALQSATSGLLPGELALIEALADSPVGETPAEKN